MLGGCGKPCVPLPHNNKAHAHCLPAVHIAGWWATVSTAQNQLAVLHNAAGNPSRILPATKQYALLWAHRLKNSSEATSHKLRFNHKSFPGKTLQLSKPGDTIWPVIDVALQKTSRFFWDIQLPNTGRRCLDQSQAKLDATFLSNAGIFRYLEHSHYTPFWQSYREKRYKDLLRQNFSRLKKQTQESRM